MTRISTDTFYALSLAGMQQGAQNVARIQQQVAAQTRILTPSDDPAAASHAVVVADRIAQLQQFQTNQTRATTDLQIEDTYLSHIEDLLTQAQTAVSGVTPATQAQVSSQLQGILSELLFTANQKDGNGQFAFAGNQGSTQPYNTTTFAYSGDQGYLQIPVFDGQNVAVSDPGNQVFPVFPVVSGPNQNAFAVINAISAKISAGNWTQTDIANASTDIGTALSLTIDVHASVAARMQQVQDATNVTTAQLTDQQNLLGSLTALDTQQAAVELTLQQTALQAAQQSFASTAKLSLFNYL